MNPDDARSGLLDLDALAAGPVADQLRLGVDGTTPQANAERAARARLVADVQAVQDEYRQAAGSHEPAAEQVPIARLVGRHGGDMAAAAADPGLVEVLRERLGAVRYEAAPLDQPGGGEMVDPLVDPDEFVRLREAVNQVRAAGGLDPMSSQQVMDAAGMAAADQEGLTGSLNARKVTDLVARLGRGEQAGVLTTYARHQFGSVLAAVEFMNADPSNNRAVYRAAAQWHLGASAGLTGQDLDRVTRDMDQRFARWQHTRPEPGPGRVRTAERIQQVLAQVRQQRDAREQGQPRPGHQPGGPDQRRGPALQ